MQGTTAREYVSSAEFRTMQEMLNKAIEVSMAKDFEHLQKVINALATCESFGDMYHALECDQNTVPAKQGAHSAI